MATKENKKPFSESEHFVPIMMAIAFIGIFVLTIPYQNNLLLDNIPGTPMYRINHQCDAELNGYGDPYCYAYKNSSGEWYSIEVSREIAKRSGGDMNRFDSFHKR